MGNVKHGNRSKFSLLPFKIRYFIICMLHDGATAKTILDHPRVQNALKEHGLEMSASLVTKIRDTPEYAEITEKRKKTRETYSGLQLSAALLQDCEAAATIAEQLKINLLELVRQCAAAKPDKPQELERLVRASVQLANSTKDFRINSLKMKISTLTEENHRLHRALAQSRADAEEKQTPPNPEEVADRLSEILGVKRNSNEEKSERECK